MAGRRRNTTSLYDSSVSLAANFVRASSFALAELTLGRSERATAAAPGPTKPTFPVAASPPADVWKLVVEEPRAASYVMEPPPPAVDKLAEEYIQKVRKRMRAQQYYSGPPNVNTLPPPPPPPTKYKVALE